MKQTDPEPKVQFTVVERAIIYARVSTDEQAESGTSLDNQVEKSLAYAEANNIQVVTTFREDFTGRVLDRPELNKAREMLRAGQADNLIVYKTNRLDRSEWGINLLILLQELKALGVGLHYSEARRRVDLTNPIEALMQSISGWQAGEDHRETIKKLYDGRISRARAGYVVPTGAKAPYGYRVVRGDDKHWYFEIDESEAKVIRMIFTWYVIGDVTGQKLSIGAIATRLSEMKIPTQADKKPGYVKKQEYGKWHRSSVSNILNNKTYAGRWTFGKEGRTRDGKSVKGQQLVSVEVPAIISREVFELAREQIDHNKDFARRNRKSNYLLARRVKCGHCGLKMVSTTSTSKGRFGYYYCPAKSGLNRLHTCDLPYFRCDVVDTKVWDRLEEISGDPDKLLEGLQGYQARQADKVEPIHRELTYVDQLLIEKTAEWEDDLLNMKFLTSDRARAKKAADIAQTEAIVNELETRKRSLKAQLQEKSLTDEQAVSITAFAAQIAESMAVLKEAEKHGRDLPELRKAVFEAKRKLLEVLDLEVTLFVENGKKKARITAKYCPDGDVIPIEYGITGITVLNRQTVFLFVDVIDLE